MEFVVGDFWVLKFKCIVKGFLVIFDKINVRKSLFGRD